MRIYRPQKRFPDRYKHVVQNVCPPRPNESKKTYILQATHKREHYIPMQMCSSAYATVRFEKGELKTEFTVNENEAKLCGLQEEVQGIIDHFANSKRCSIFRSRDDLEDYCIRVRRSEAFFLKPSSAINKDTDILLDCEWLFKIVCEKYTYYLSFMYGERLSDKFKIYCFKNSRLEIVNTMWEEGFDW